MAIHTRLGWAVFGGVTGKQDTNAKFINTHQIITNATLHQLVKDYFSIENLGIQAPKSQVLSMDEKRANEIMERTLKRVSENRFEVGLLWKFDVFNLPDSFKMAYWRLLNFERKMKTDHELSNSVKVQMVDYEKKGYIRKLTQDESKTITATTWYLPLFAVRNPNKPGKIRMVWDAAAVVEGISLNSMLIQGPDLLQNLLSIIFRFREKQFAIVGDIREMFHQIQLRPQDRNSQRFLWRNDDDETLAM